MESLRPRHLLPAVEHVLADQPAEYLGRGAQQRLLGSLVRHLGPQGDGLGRAVGRCPVRGPVGLSELSDPEGDVQLLGSKVGYAKALLSSARAGHSEHQLGTTLDLRSYGGSAPWNYKDWGTTKAGAWLKANAWKYGFVMTYPKGKTSVTCYQYEPWHYRYVGRDTARKVRASGLTLREYLWKQQTARPPSPTPTKPPTPTPTATPSPTAPPPAPTPTAEPTATPTIEPTATPDGGDDAGEPTTAPTATPTTEPTATPPPATPSPTTEPTATPTTEPTATPDDDPPDG